MSGCLSVTLSPGPRLERRGKVWVTDKLMPEAQVGFVRWSRHLNPALALMPIKERFFFANQILDEYRAAAEVETDRLHCYLPCVAFQTPVTYTRALDHRTRGLVNVPISFLQERAIVAKKHVRDWIQKFSLPPAGQ